MRWLSLVPCKATLVLLFKAARRRVATQTGDIEALPNARIISATEELNQIADDIREAQPTVSLMDVPCPEISTPTH